MSGRVTVALLLAAGIALSAVAVIHSEHRSRTLFAELQELNRERDALDAEWGRLRLEQGAWATHGRIERLAREELNMIMPGQEDVVVLRRTETAGD